MTPAQTRVGQVRLATAEEFLPPEGGRVLVVQEVPSRPNMGWEETVTSACPQTPGDRDILSDRRVDKLWTPVTVATATDPKNTGRTVILPDFGRDWDSWEAFLWALLPHPAGRIRNTNPQDVWDLAAHVPDFHRQVQWPGRAWVISLNPKCLEGRLVVCDARFDTGGVRAFLDFLDRGWGRNALPAFICEVGSLVSGA